MKKTKIFLLEDNPLRIEWFKNNKHLELLNIDKADLFMSDNVIEAKEIFEKEGPFDVYFLDHDLGEKQMVNSEDENTGYQFAKYMVESGIGGSKCLICLHSLNPIGRAKMKSLFKYSTEVQLFNF